MSEEDVLLDAHRQLEAAQREQQAHTLAREMSRSLRLLELLSHAVDVRESPHEGEPCELCSETRRITEAARAR